MSSSGRQWKDQMVWSGFLFKGQFLKSFMQPFCHKYETIPPPFGPQHMNNFAFPIHLFPDQVRDLTKPTPGIQGDKDHILVNARKTYSWVLADRFFRLRLARIFLTSGSPMSLNGISPTTGFSQLLMCSFSLRTDSGFVLTSA